MTVSPWATHRTARDISLGPSGLPHKQPLAAVGLQDGQRLAMVGSDGRLERRRLRGPGTKKGHHLEGKQGGRDPGLILGSHQVVPEHLRRFRLARCPGTFD